MTAPDDFPLKLHEQLLAAEPDQKFWDAVVRHAVDSSPAEAQPDLIPPPESGTGADGGAVDLTGFPDEDPEGPDASSRSVDDWPNALGPTDDVSGQEDVGDDFGVQSEPWP